MEGSAMKKEREEEGDNKIIKIKQSKIRRIGN